MEEQRSRLPGLGRVRVRASGLSPPPLSGKDEARGGVLVVFRGGGRDHHLRCNTAGHFCLPGQPQQVFLVPAGLPCSSRPTCYLQERYKQGHVIFHRKRS